MSANARDFRPALRAQLRYLALVMLLPGCAERRCKALASRAQQYLVDSIVWEADRWVAESLNVSVRRTPGTPEAHRRADSVLWAFYATRPAPLTPSERRWEADHCWMGAAR